jgi:hypothetical protein
LHFACHDLSRKNKITSRDYTCIRIEKSSRQAEEDNSSPIHSGHTQNMYCFTLAAENKQTRILSKWFYDTSTGAATGAVRCGSFVGEAQIAQGVGYQGIRWT